MAVLVVLATTLNDSGVQVTGMIPAMTLPTLVFLATRFVDTDDEQTDQIDTRSVSQPSI